MKRTLLLVVLLSLSMTPGFAESPKTGVITGTVTDVTGQPQPGVAVTIEGNRGSSTVITDDFAVYRFALLTAGSYTLKAEVDGFRPAESTATLGAGGTVEINLRLTPQGNEEHEKVPPES